MDLVTVEFLAPYAERGGARFNARERAGLPPEVASDLAARGIVRILPQKPQATALAGPPADTMVRAGKKKSRFL